MAEITDILINYGYMGMFVAAFLAGSFLPFSSEAVMVALLAAGLGPSELVVSGTLGNTLGSMLNYGIGRMGRMEWIEKYHHVKREKVESTQRWMRGRGAWMGFFAFVPILGTAICIVLGLTRANPVITLFTVFAGKVIRYGLLIGGVGLLF